MVVKQQEATETLMYTFDYPMLTESGQVKITDECITLQCPEKPTVYVKDSVKIPKNVTLFIENSHCLSLDWIPVHTWTDYFRVKDMIEKCLQSYCNLTGNTCFTPHTFVNSSGYHESITTNFSTDNFSLSCFEHLTDTCIQLSVAEEINDDKETPLHFQLCIGKHIVFSTERDLHCVTNASNVHFIVQFILFKLLNISIL